jgi:hypothetical protein
MRAKNHSSHQTPYLVKVLDITTVIMAHIIVKTGPTVLYIREINIEDVKADNIEVKT